MHFEETDTTYTYFNVHLSALRFLCVVSLGMLWFLTELGDVLHHLWGHKTTWGCTSAAAAATQCQACVCLSNLSEGLSLVLFTSVLGNLLQGSGPLSPLLHLDQTRQQANQQKENQQAQQGNDGHIQWLQLVGYMVAQWEEREKDMSGRVNNSTGFSLTYWNSDARKVTDDKRKGIFLVFSI